jgi:phospholipid/cholesterol/gamma-HCH transport system substrate-binding protein
MARTQEEVKVGVVVVVAGVVFLTALVFVGGANLLRKKKATYITYFRFAGGLEPGSFVRFGGLKVGSVRGAEIDPGDSTRIRVQLQVNAETPIRTNSRARISTLGFLGENYVEISAGTRDAALLAPGREIPALEIVQLADVFNNVNNVTVNANRLVNDLDDKFMVLAANANELVKNLNAVTNPENRQHIDATLRNLDAILSDSRPKLSQTLDHLQMASGKLSPAIDSANAAIVRANTLVGNMNGLVQENRQEIHQVLLRLGDSLVDLRQLLAEIDDLVVNNRANVDETLENIRVSSQNLKQFTGTIKQRPFSLLRVKAERDRVPPAGK